MENLNTSIRNGATNYPVALPRAGTAGVRALPGNTAGNLMKTEYAAIRPNLAAADAIRLLHQMSGTRHQNGGRMFYVYVTDEDNHLLGIFSLNNLISACPGVMVSDFMKKDIISVTPEEDPARLAQIIAQHDLLALPVVDGQNHLLGIVTADDALDTVIPADWKKRLPRFYR
jgi:magnesium transporter